MSVKSFYQNEDGGLRATRIAGTVATAFLAAATAWSGLYVNEGRQITLEVLFGNIVDQVNSPGLKVKMPFFADRFAYSLARQTSPIDNTTTLRMGDDLRLDADFTVEWEIQEGVDAGKLYYDLKDRGGDIDNVVMVRGQDAAIRTLESLTIEDLIPPNADMPQAQTGADTSASFTQLMTSGIQGRLQQEFLSQGWPIKVISVYSNGFKFSPPSEIKLEEIVGIRQERVKLALREENAVKAAEVFAAEARADAAYVNELVAKGLGEDQIGTALCLKMARDAGRVNEPFAAGCNNGASLPVAAAVPLPAKQQPGVAPAPAAPL